MKRLPAEMRRGQDEQFLRKALLRASCRKHGIGEEIIHRRKPRRGKISDARHLYGRRTVREDGQRHPRRMPREINENVDAVAVNCFCRRLCREMCEAANPRNRLPHLLRIAVWRIQCVNRHLEMHGVKTCHQGIRKGEHNVLPDIG